MKKEINEKTQIVIEKAWLQSLLKYAEITQKLSEGQYENNLRIALSGLLGYISSAKTILKSLKEEL